MGIVAQRYTAEVLRRCRMIDVLYEKEKAEAQLNAREEWIAKRLDDVVADYCEIAGNHKRRDCLKMISEYAEHERGNGK